LYFHIQNLGSRDLFKFSRLKFKAQSSLASWFNRHQRFFPAVAEINKYFQQNITIVFA